MDLSFDRPDDGPVPVTERVTSAKTRRYLVAAALLGGGVTLGALFSPIGLANAQSDDTSTSDTTTSDSTTADSTDTSPGSSDATTTDDSASDDDGDGRGHGCGGRGAKLEALATVLGLTVDELRTEIEADKSLADIAEAQGVSEDAVVDALLAHRKEHLDAAVAAGRIEQAEADEKLAAAETEIRERLDDVPAVLGRGGHAPGGFGRGFGGLAGIQELADSLGLDLDALRTAVAGGQTVAEAAAAQGVAGDDLKAALVAAATERIDEALAADRIDEARADELKSGLEAKIDSFVNGTMTGGFGGWGHGGPGGGRGFGHHRDGADDGTSDDSTSDDSTSSDAGDTQQSSYTA